MISALILTGWTMMALSQQAPVWPRTLAEPAVLLFWIGFVFAIGRLSDWVSGASAHDRPRATPAAGGC
jgi:hypothetical protein